MITGLIVGILIGFIFTIPPLGPTYFQIIQQGLRNQTKNGIAIGAGAGFMDMFYILVAFGGVSLISSLIPENIQDYFSENSVNLKLILALCGSLFVIIYGIKILITKQDFSHHIEEHEVKEKFKQRYDKVENVLKKTEAGLDKMFKTEVLEKHHSGVTLSFITGVVSCLSSPTLPASWFAIVGYLKSYGLINSNLFSGVFLALGVFLGTTAWFYLMVNFVSKNSVKINPSLLQKLSNFMGLVLIGIGVVILINLYLYKF
ncbi:MAG: LysE family transporter [Bacteroidetes bacterium]|nr:LysE family transporter [Bacteroidota bacterium]